MLPGPDDVAGDLERCMEAVERAEELDEKKSVPIDESCFTRRMVVEPDKIHVTGTVAGSSRSCRTCSASVSSYASPALPPAASSSCIRRSMRSVTISRVPRGKKSKVGCVMLTLFDSAFTILRLPPMDAPIALHLGIRLHLAGLSLSGTISLRERFGVGRCRSIVHT